MRERRPLQLLLTENELCLSNREPTPSLYILTLFAPFWLHDKKTYPFVTRFHLPEAPLGKNSPVRN